MSPTGGAGALGAWRLEWLRLRRTPRLVVLAVVFAFLGLTGPLSVRYLPELLDRFASEMDVTMAPATAADGIASFTKNAQQLGVLAVVVLAVGPMGFVTRRGLAWFYRTRVTRPVDLVLPRLVATAAVSVGAHTLGLALAWYETAVLIGKVPVGAMLGGWALSSLFVVLAVALAMAAAGVLGSATAAMAVSVGVLWLLPVAGLRPPLERWLPPHLAAAPAQLAAGGTVAGHLPALAVTVLATALLAALTVAAVARHEL